MRLLRLALLERHSVEHDVALLAFEALEGLALEPTAPADPNAAYLRLAPREDTWLRAGAARAWREIYGTPLAVVEPQ